MTQAILEDYDNSMIYDFLKVKTQQAWVDRAVNNQEMMLIDHAHCEKKAASSAVNLLYRYADKPDLLHKMSRLAREELRHFEQVLKLIDRRGFTYRSTSPASYAQVLRSEVREPEPQRLVDQLIVGAIIEARSCERFHCIAPHLDEELAKFYRGLLACEARHFKDYLELAKQYANEDIEPRVKVLVSVENEFILSSCDEAFRFHSPN